MGNTSIATLIFAVMLVNASRIGPRKCLIPDQISWLRIGSASLRGLRAPRVDADRNIAFALVGP
jgi:hypothetical protein